MDEIVKLVENNAPEIIYLEALIESLKNERDIDVLILASSKMLRALGHIMPALSNPSPKLCITNPEDSVRAFKSMAHAMIDIRNHREIEVDETARQLLEFSSKVMYDTGKFIFKMNKSLKIFRKNCQNNQMKDVAVYNTIIDIMENLADLFNVLDMDEKSNAIKEQIEFVKRIVVSLKYQKLNIYNIVLFFSVLLIILILSPCLTLPLIVTSKVVPMKNLLRHWMTWEVSLKMLELRH